MHSLTGCSSHYKVYEDTDANFYPVPENPEILIYYDAERKGYYKVIHFTSHYELSHPGYGDMFNTKIEPGYHLADGQGYNGYDFEHTFKSANDAISQASKSGNIYFFNLGSEYQFHDGSLYSTNPFHKLNKR
ncbi:MAG: hypothetical protein BGO70_03695 [Bacteroidetes bacterium 43-93]|nr:MAG: hypothetical protein BGO70_03695 [Bacteroidetes bacterium 43-93]